MQNFRKMLMAVFEKTIKGGYTDGGTDITIWAITKKLFRKPPVQKCESKSGRKSSVLSHFWLTASMTSQECLECLMTPEKNVWNVT